jgi:Zn-dependent protease
LPAIDVAQLFIAFLVLLFSLTVHESAHALAADRLGDPTARLLGRVSLNPAVHIDPVGTILFPVMAAIARMPMIGWAKPVPVSVHRLRHPRRDYMLVAGAGPASNLALAMTSAIALRWVPLSPSGAGDLDVWAPLAMLAARGVEINVLLAIFNMVPIPPLDGGTVLAGLLPERMADGLDHLRPYGFFIIYALMLTGVLGYLVGPPYYLLLSWLR